MKYYGNNKKNIKGFIHLLMKYQINKKRQLKKTCFQKGFIEGG